MGYMLVHLMVHPEIQIIDFGQFLPVAKLTRDRLRSPAKSGHSASTHVLQSSRKTWLVTGSFVARRMYLLMYCGLDGLLCGSASSYAPLARRLRSICVLDNP